MVAAEQPPITLLPRVLPVASLMQQLLRLPMVPPLILMAQPGQTGFVVGEVVAAAA